LADAILDDLTALVPPLLQALEAGGFVARYLHPPQLGQVLAAIGEADAPLLAERARLDAWPDDMADLRDRLAAAADGVLKAFEGLREAALTEDVGTAYRALGQLPRAQEQLYPLSPALPPVSRFFLDPARREDAELQARLADPAPDTGVMHIDNERGQRGGRLALRPGDLRPGERPSPRRGPARRLRPRARLPVDLVARRQEPWRDPGRPDAIGATWALSGPDPDTPNLARIVAGVRDRWNIDPERILLTGMSDGGTFSYVSGWSRPRLHPPGPGLAAFHPMLAQMADAERIAGLPIHVAHGSLDWMFPVAMAREAVQALTAAGAEVTCREIEDLSHTYPRELNSQLLTGWIG
jgi:phospholipase/carboxylesterase